MLIALPSLEEATFQGRAACIIRPTNPRVRRGYTHTRVHSGMRLQLDLDDRGWRHTRAHMIVGSNNFAWRVRIFRERWKKNIETDERREGGVRGGVASRTRVTTRSTIDDVRTTVARSRDGEHPDADRHPHVAPGAVSARPLLPPPPGDSSPLYTVLFI